METFWSIAIVVMETLILLCLVYRKLDYQGLKSALIAAAAYALVLIIIYNIYLAWTINSELGSFGMALFSEIFTFKFLLREWITYVILFEIYTAICCGIYTKTESSSTCVGISLVICLMVYYFAQYVIFS